MADLQRTVLKYALGTISFDCVEVEDAEHDATITRYPVEASAKRADHIVIEPEVVRLTVHVTNAPLQTNRNVSHMDGVQPSTTLNVKDLRSTGFRNESKTVNDVAPVPFAGAVGLNSVAGIELNLSRPLTLQIDGAETFTSVTAQAAVRAWGLDGEVAKRVQNVYTAMLDAQKNAELFTVVTEHRPYDGMMIKSVRMNRTSKTVRAPKFEIELHQFFTTTLQTRDVSNRFPSKDRSKPKQDAGKKQPTDADAKTNGKSKSVAKSLFGGD
jgi:hypothetical protein